MRRDVTPKLVKSWGRRGERGGRRVIIKGYPRTVMLAKKPLPIKMIHTSNQRNE